MSEKHELPETSPAARMAEIDNKLGQAGQALDRFSDETAREAFAGLLEELQRMRDNLKAVGLGVDDAKTHDK